MKYFKQNPVDDTEHGCGRQVIPAQTCPLLHVYNLGVGDRSWQRDFTDVMKLRILKRGEVLDYPGGPSVVIMVLIRDEQEGLSQRRGCDEGSRGGSDAAMDLEWVELAKNQDVDSSLAPPEGTSPADTLILDQRGSF